MAAILDAATMLIPAGLISSSQDFPALQLHPRKLATSDWVVALTVPAAATATFTLAVSSTQAGTYRTIQRLDWPAGTSGSKQVPLGVQGRTAQFLDNQAQWIRVSVALSGPLTMAGSWLTKASDGSFGLASRSYHLDNIGAI